MNNNSDLGTHWESIYLQRQHYCLDIYLYISISSCSNTPFRRVFVVPFASLSLSPDSQRRAPSSWMTWPWCHFCRLLQPVLGTHVGPKSCKHAGQQTLILVILGALIDFTHLECLDVFRSYKLKFQKNFHWCHASLTFFQARFSLIPGLSQSPSHCSAVNPN